MVSPYILVLVSSFALTSSPLVRARSTVNGECRRVIDRDIFEASLSSFLSLKDLCSDFARFHKDHERTYTPEEDEFSIRVNAYALSRKEIQILNASNPFAEFGENR